MLYFYYQACFTVPMNSKTHGTARQGTARFFNKHGAIMKFTEQQKIEWMQAHIELGERDGEIVITEITSDISGNLYGYHYGDHYGKHVGKHYPDGEE